MVFPMGHNIVPTEQAPPGNRFYVIPGKSGYPRWILPCDSRKGMRGLVYWQPYDWFSRVRWNIILTAYRADALKYLPGVQHIGVLLPSGSDWQHLNLAGSVQPVVYVGTPMNKSKAVSFLIDENNRCVGIAKSPIGASAAEKILHEASVLHELETAYPGLAPRLLYRNNQAGIAIQEVLPVQMTSLRMNGEHITWLKRMEQTGEISLVKAANSLWQRYQALSPQPWIEKILSHFPNISVPCVRRHGDFAPWNIKRLPDKNLIVIDWEESQDSDVAGYDLLYFHIIQAYLKGKSRSLVPELLQNPLIQSYLSTLNLSPKTFSALQTYVMLDYACNRLEEGDAELANEFLQVMRPFMSEDVG